MAANIPVRFKRITAMFDDVARARLCDSSGSEHSAAENSVTDLSGLVDSFFEGEVAAGSESCEESKKIKNRDEETDECLDLENSDSDTKEMLRDLIGGDAEEEAEAEAEEDSGVKRMIRAEIEAASQNLENGSPEEFKRRLMTLLRQRGFDAGLCKSRWERTGRHPAGEYEYVDTIISNTRYIIEVSLATQFTIARPTETYSTLLEIIPHILLIRESDLKQVVRLMCAAMRVSMKKRDMLVSPWRRNGYMQSKWFGSYRRTTNAVSSKLVVRGDVVVVGGRSFVGFESAAPAAGRVVVQGGCRREVVKKTKGGLHQHVVGNLKAAFSGMG